MPWDSVSDCYGASRNGTAAGLSRIDKGLKDKGFVAVARNLLDRSDKNNEEVDRE